MSDLMREEFEIAFIKKQVDQFGEGFRDTAVQMLKRSGDFESTPTHYDLERRRLGLYDAYWVEMLWWAWQASRECLVIELPESFEFHDPYEAGLAIRACRESIRATGVKTK